MPKNVIRVALPGYNAETDTDPDHFALYSDEDWVLIKEAKRGTATLLVPDAVSGIIKHNIGYTPMVMVFRYDVGGYDANVVSGRWKSISYSNGLPGRAIRSTLGTPSYTINSVNLRMGGTGTNKYYIFYDYEEL